MSKSQRVKGESKFDQEPLNAHEVSISIGLLHRAVVNGQGQLLMEGYRKYPERLAYAETARTVMEVMKEIANEDSPSSSGYPSPAMTGGMSEAAKRRLDLEEVGTSDWEKVSGCGGSSIAEMFPTHVGKPASKGPMPDASNPQLLIIKKSEMYPMKSVNPRIPIPTGYDLTSWGKVICKMDKVVALGLSYRRMIEFAKIDEATCNYMDWIIKSYGTNGTGVVKNKKDGKPGKITPAVDLAMYLEHVGWQPNRYDTNTTFTRVLED